MMTTGVDDEPSTIDSPQENVCNANNNVEKMAQKIKQLEAILNERNKRAISDDEIAMKMFPPIDPDEVVPQSSDTETEAASVNSANDKPFLSKIGDHRSKTNGLILFRCHDTDDENDSWCDADKAVTNVGKKEFKRYVKINKLKEQTYTPATAQPVKAVGKKDLKRLANISKGKSNGSKVITKIIEKRKTNNGQKYKVITEDLQVTWKTMDEMGPDYTKLITEYDDMMKNLEQTKTKSPKKSPKKSPNKNKKTTKTKGTQKRKQSSNNKANEGGTPKRKQSSNKKANEGGTPKRKQSSKNKANEGGTAKRKKSSNNKANEGGTATRKQSSKNKANEGGTAKPSKPFCCRLNHKKYQSYKAEGDKKWFGPNQRFDNSQCFICKKNIGIKPTDDNFVPSVAKPAYICVNSTKNCKKNLCHFCCAKLMINDNSENTNKTRRSTRTR